MEDTDGFCPRCGTATSEKNDNSESMRAFFSAPSVTTAPDRPVPEAGQNSSRIRFSKSFSPAQAEPSNSGAVTQSSYQGNSTGITQELKENDSSTVNNRSKTTLVVAIIAGVLLLLGILAIIIIIPKIGHNPQNGEGSEPALSNSSSDNQAGVTEPGRSSDYSYLYGSWNYYTGGTFTEYGAAGAEATMLQLNADGTANLYYFVTNSGVGSSYEGVWSADEAIGNAVTITLNMRDYSEAVGEDRGNSYRYTEKISASVIGDTLEISNQSGDLNYFDAGTTLERGLTLEDWTSRMQVQGYWKEDGTSKQLAWDIIGTWDGYNTNYGTGWYELEITIYAADQESVTADWAYTSTNLYGTRSTDTGNSSDIWVIECNDEYLEIGVQYGTALTSYNSVYFYSDGTAVVEFPFVGTGQMTHTPLASSSRGTYSEGYTSMSGYWIENYRPEGQVGYSNYDIVTYLCLYDDGTMELTNNGSLYEDVYTEYSGKWDASVNDYREVELSLWANQGLSHTTDTSGWNYSTTLTLTVDENQFEVIGTMENIHISIMGKYSNDNEFLLSSMSPIAVNRGREL